MALKTPLALGRLCRDYLPSLLTAADGRRMLETVSAIVETDRWCGRRRPGWRWPPTV